MHPILKILIFLLTMLKILSKIFPLFDHLYIFQILEYDMTAFLKWFLKYPFKRNLQKKHKLEYTNKIKLLLIFSFFWILISNFVLGFWPIFLIFIFFSPVLIFLSFITYLPLEIYYKNKIMAAAKKKLESLPNLRIVAITGSYGKTSTKDMLYTLLWKKFRVVKTPKSFNTPLGLTQTILDYLKPNTQIFIAEIGAYKIGDIKNLTKFLNPTIGVITAIGPQHLERFGSLENIRKAKMELIENLPKNGVGILNFKKFNISLPLVGEHHRQNFDTAATIAMQLGMTLAEIKDRVKWLQPTPHRLEVKKIENIIFIDNSYNSNPESANASLKFLGSFEKNRKIIITPGFVELGKEASKYNQEFGKDIRCIGDEVIIVGENAKQDLVKGIKQIDPHLENDLHFVSSTKEGIKLAQELSGGIETVVLLENDLPDQYF